MKGDFDLRLGRRHRQVAGQVEVHLEDEGTRTGVEGAVDAAAVAQDGAVELGDEGAAVAPLRPPVRQDAVPVVGPGRARGRPHANQSASSSDRCVL